MSRRTVAILILSAYAAGCQPATVNTKRSFASVGNWPGEPLQTKTVHDETGSFTHQLRLFAYDGEIKEDELKAFCLRQQKTATADVFTWVVVFDKPENVVMTLRFKGGSEAYDHLPEVQKNIRAVYCYNRFNGYSKVRYYWKKVRDDGTVERDSTEIGVG